MINEDKKYEAKWRKDFPIGWSQDNYIARREFTKFLVLASGALCLGNAYFVINKHQRNQASLRKSPLININDIPVGSSKIVTYPTENDPVIIIRQSDTDFIAFSQRCTHLSCPVQYNEAGKRIECPCHNGVFDAASGKVVSGPPTNNLPRIRLRIENEIVYAVGIEDNNA